MNKDKGTVAVAVSPALEASSLLFSHHDLSCLHSSARAGLMYLYYATCPILGSTSLLHSHLLTLSTLPTYSRRTILTCCLLDSLCTTRLLLYPATTYSALS